MLTTCNKNPESGKSYTATGTTLTFDEAPPSGTGNVYVIYRGQAEVTTRLEAPDLSITTAKLADSAVATAKIANSNVILQLKLLERYQLQMAELHLQAASSMAFLILIFGTWIPQKL